MSDGDLSRWRSLLAESEAHLSELGDPADPVARREIGEALTAKAKALHNLGRFAEAAAVWDEIARMFAVEPVDDTPRIVPRAMLGKALNLLRVGDRDGATETADALLALCDSLSSADGVRRQILGALLVKMAAVGPGKPADLIPLDDEIIRRFAGSDDPGLRKQVAIALLRKGLGVLLIGDADEAVRVSVALARRMSSAPEATLIEEAEVANKYARNLTLVARPDLRGVAVMFTFAAANTVRQLSRHLPKRVIGIGRQADRALTGSPARAFRVTPAAWRDWRRRIRAAVDLWDVVISAVGDDPDPDRQRVANVARIGIAIARLVSGDPAGGGRELIRLRESGDPAVVQAFQQLAAELRGRRDVPGQIAELGLLASRATALAQNDSRIERIAYEDSVAPVLAETTHRPVRWIAALLKPAARR